MRAGLALVPRRLLWTVARRYVAGDQLSDALAAVARLRGEGYGTILDVLGEGVETVAQAQAAAAEYQRALAALPAVDPGCVVSGQAHAPRAAARPRAVRAAARRAVHGGGAPEAARRRLEMEDAPTVDATLAVFRGLRARHPNLGCVLQARLFRTEADARALLEQGPGLNVRLVKGIYQLASIAWTAAPDIAASYVKLARLLLEGGAYVGLATHDGAMAAGLDRYLRERGLDLGEAGARRYEYQCLMGVRQDFAQAQRNAGHAVRIYVPYGSDWRGCCAACATTRRSRGTSCAPCCAARAEAAARRAATLLLALLTGCGESADAPTPRAATAAPARPPSLLLVSFDTLRGHHVGCYGGPSGAQPITRTSTGSRGGRLVRAYFAPRGQTHPSLAAMLSGKYPITTGLRENRLSLLEEHQTFLEDLSAAGWRTGIFLANFDTDRLGGAWAFRGAEVAVSGKLDNERARPAASRRSGTTAPRPRRWSSSGASTRRGPSPRGCTSSTSTTRTTRPRASISSATRRACPRRCRRPGPRTATRSTAGWRRSRWASTP